MIFQYQIGHFLRDLIRHTKEKSSMQVVEKSVAYHRKLFHNFLFIFPKLIYV